MLERREVPKKLEMRLKCVRRSYFEKEALRERGMLLAAI